MNKYNQEVTLRQLHFSATEIPNTHNYIRNTASNEHLNITNNIFQKPTTYTLNIPVDAIEDLAGNVADEYTLNFTTVLPLN